MSITITNATGDGQHSTLIEASVELPDSGTTAKVSGIVQAAGGQEYTFSAASVTIPATPAEGVTAYYIIQANLTTGVINVKESSEALPQPDENCVAILKQTLTHSTADPALVTATTPSS